MLARFQAVDPLNRFLPSPGEVERVRFPGGAGIRVDSYVDQRTRIPGRYDPLFAKLTSWGTDREEALARLRMGLEETKIDGVNTNIPALKKVTLSAPFREGKYPIIVEQPPDPAEDERLSTVYQRDLAVAAAVLFTFRNRRFEPSQPEPFRRGWHRSGRQLTGG